jgi:hypothetical protein
MVHRYEALVIAKFRSSRFSYDVISLPFEPVLNKISIYEADTWNSVTHVISISLAYILLYFRGPCKPEFYYGLFHLHTYRILTPILTADFSFHLIWPTDFDCGLFRLPNLETLILITDFFAWNRVTVGATGQQGMLTPPRHLIPSPVYPAVLVSPFISLTCNSYLRLETDHSFSS